MYFVFELQKLNNGNCALIPYHDDAWDYLHAESVFHGKCAAAAISEIPVHSVMLVDVEGAVYQTKTYNH